MEIRYIKDFIMMAEYEDLFETSEQLFISQSSLSRHIKSIEEELQIQLFDRGARNMKLNAYGEIFLKYARQIVQLDEACKAELGHEEVKKANVLHISSLSASVGYGITDLLESFNREYPEYQISIHEADSDTNWERLRRYESDFAFVLEYNEDHTGVERLRIAKDHLVAVVRRDHPFAALPAISAHTIGSEPIILYDKSNFLHRYCISLFERDHVKPFVAATAFRGENMIDLVEHGMGIALLMNMDVHELENDKTVVLPVEPQRDIIVNLVYRNGMKFRQIDREFLECAEAHIRERVMEE